MTSNPMTDLQRARRLTNIRVEDLVSACISKASESAIWRKQRALQAAVEDLIRESQLAVQHTLNKEQAK